MHVYADVVVLINLVLNSMILFITGWVVGRKSRGYRLIIAAFLGSIYALVGVFPSLAIYYTPICKLFISAILLFIAFGKQNIRSFLLLIAIFYIVSFVFGGAVIGWIFFCEDEFFTGKYNFSSVTIQQLISGTLLAALLLILVGRNLVSKINRKSLLYQLYVHYDHKQVKVISMLDTGNRLLTPVDKKPVLLVELEYLMPLFNDQVSDLLKAAVINQDISQINLCTDNLFVSRIQIIPYCSVGHSSLLLAFRPDFIEVVVNKNVIRTDQAVIAFYNHPFTSDQSYHALLSPGVFSLSGICN